MPGSEKYEVGRTDAEEIRQEETRGVVLGGRKAQEQ